MQRLRNLVLLLWQAPLVAATYFPVISDDVNRDIRRFLQPRLDLSLPEELDLADVRRAVRHRPLRSVLYWRLRTSGKVGRTISLILARLYPGEVAMYISCREIGPGFMMMHGFATIITATRIGQDCQVSQQVTIGYDDRGGCPTIGNRVRIGANAVVIGPIYIADDAVIGAGAVVVKNVAPGTVVGGVPARALQAEDRFRSPLSSR